MRRYSILTLFLLILGTGYWTMQLDRTPTTNLQKPGKQAINVLLGGDIYAGNRMMEPFYRKGAQYFTKKVDRLSRRADLHLANLESPITKRTTTNVNKRYILRSHPQVGLRVLRHLGVDGVSLANNHMMDYGARGLLDTVNHLSDNGVKFTGAGANREWASKPVYFRKKGNRIGFVAFSNTYPESFWAHKKQPGTAYGSPELVKRRIKELEAQSDFSIVSFHWGDELDTHPKSYQEQLARLAVRNGVDVVFGHHPHSVQPIEYYKDGVILYSLGNYFFTTKSSDVQHGLLANVRLKNGKRPDVKFHVLNVNNFQVGYRPEPVRQFQNPRQVALFFKRPDFRVAETVQLP
ncbi:MAG: CapA family protein [bacterium]